LARKGLLLCCSWLAEVPPQPTHRHRAFSVNYRKPGPEMQKATNPLRYNKMPKPLNADFLYTSEIKVQTDASEYKLVMNIKFIVI
jgi:hypothetical protein